MEKPYFQVPKDVKDGLEKLSSPEEVKAFLKNTPYGGELLSKLELLASGSGEATVQRIVVDVQSLSKWGYEFLHRESAVLDRKVKQIEWGVEYLNTLKTVSEKLGDGYLTQENLKKNLRTLETNLQELATSYNAMYSHSRTTAAGGVLIKPSGYKARGVMNS